MRSNLSRQIERCRALKRSIDATIEQVSIAKGSSMAQGYIEELSRGQKVA